MSKPIRPDHQRRLIALLVAFGIAYYLVQFLFFLVIVYLAWDIYSTYRRMMSGM